VAHLCASLVVRTCEKCLARSVKSTCGKCVAMARGPCETTQLSEASEPRQHVVMVMLGAAIQHGARKSHAVKVDDEATLHAALRMEDLRDVMRNAPRIFEEMLHAVMVTQRNAPRIFEEMLHVVMVTQRSAPRIFEEKLHVVMVTLAVEILRVAASHKQKQTVSMWGFPGLTKQGLIASLRRQFSKECRCGGS